jgi:hypothetical protein|tara:strand:+ start:297 stop:539 length:243 start_codon:yes stop_codon:yes gene_type:complete
MFGIHHMTEVAYVLVITMWGHTGAGWQYIGNQIVLQEAMTEEQCVYIIDEKMWKASYENKHYRLMAHCFPEDCAGKSNCE